MRMFISASLARLDMYCSKLLAGPIVSAGAK